MKIKLLLLVLVLVAGIVLGGFYYQQHKAVDSDAYIDSLSLINQIKQTNATVNILLLKSRYGLQADYDDLSRENIAIVNSVKSLERSDLGRYLSNGPLAETFKSYSTKAVIRSDVVESFKAHNAVLRNSIKYAPPLGDRLVAELKAANSPSVNFLESINKALYRWSLYGDLEQAEFIKANVSKILDLLPQFKDETPLIEYNTHVMAAVDEQEQTQLYLENALSVDLESILDLLAEQYTQAYLDSSSRQAKQLSYALWAYSVLTFLIAAYFAWSLRKSYVGLETKVKERTQKVDQAYSELKQSQEHLVQSEKMAALGQMVAGIAHEINTPLGYISNNIFIIDSSFKTVEVLMGSLEQLYKEAIKKPYSKQMLSQHLVQVLKRYRRMRHDGTAEEAKELLSDSAQGLSDISELVTNLRTFSRLDGQTLERFDVCEGINSTLKIAKSILREANVMVVTKYESKVFIDGNPSKVNQVFLNIITNAAQAMPETGGKLIIDVKQTQDSVVVRFKDTGKGMDENTRAKMFDPFFTTKPIGQGTGLGMAISYKIVEEHSGTIDVSSAEGKGTEITLSFPISDK